MLSPSFRRKPESRLWTPAFAGVTCGIRDRICAIVYFKYLDVCAANPINKIRRIVGAGLALPGEGAASGAPTFGTARGGASTCLGAVLYYRPVISDGVS